MMHKRVLVIDDADVSDVMKSLQRKAKQKGITFDFDQFNVGNQKLQCLFALDGSLDVNKVKEYFTDNFSQKYYDIVACDYQLSVDNIDGPELLRKMSTECFGRKQRYLIYSGLLNQIVEEHVKPCLDQGATDGKLVNDLVTYIKHLVNAQYIGFVDREDMPVALLNHLSDNLTLENILGEAVCRYPNMVLKYGFNHNLEGRKLKDCSKEILKNDILYEDFMRDLLEQTLIYLSEKM